MKLKRALALVAALAVAGPAMAADYTLKFSVSKNSRPNHFVYTPVEVFEEELERLSDGRIDVKVYWAGALGGIESVLGLVKDGHVEGVLASDGHLAPFYKDIQVLSIPYLFSSRDVAREVLAGEFGTGFADRIGQESGIRPLAFMENGGYRHYSSSKPVTSAADMAGLKIRTMTNPLHMEIVRALGASPTPIAWADLYTSLQTGVVDGQENSLSTFRTPKLEEVQKNIILDGHVYSVISLFISEKFYQSLPDDLKEAVQQAGQAALARNYELSVSNEIEDRRYLEEYGVNIVDVSLEEKEIFREMTQGPVIAKLDELGIDKDLTESLLNAVDAAEGK